MRFPPEMDTLPRPFTGLAAFELAIGVGRRTLGAGIEYGALRFQSYDFFILFTLLKVYSKF